MPTSNTPIGPVAPGGGLTRVATPENPGPNVKIGANAIGASNLSGGGGLLAGLNANITQWFIRIGEVVLGIVLVAVGVAKLTGIQNTIAKAAKVAAL